MATWKSLFDGEGMALRGGCKCIKEDFPGGKND